MSIIIQAGHKTSKSKQLMETLYERGLSKPKESYTHKMTAEQVSETLYKVLIRENMSSANEKMADNIMVDLILANLDAEHWGWDSDNNLANLEYWGQVEPDVKFILVFDHPKKVFEFINFEELTITEVDRLISDWVNYHENMLKVFESESNRVILVEGDSSIQKFSEFSSYLSNITNNLELKKNWQVWGKESKDTELSKNKYSNIASDIIIDQILKSYPETVSVFNTLLSKATMKKSEVIYKSKSPSLDGLVHSLNYTMQCLNSKDLEAIINKLEQEKVSLVKNKDAKIKQLQDEIKQLQEKNYLVENELSNNGTQKILEVSECLDSESKLLVEQLSQVQEELEMFYSKNEKLRPLYLKSNFNIENGFKYYGAVDRVKEDLPYRLGNTIINNSKSINDIMRMPVKLIQEYKDFKNSDFYNLPNIEDYEDSYKAEKVKNHLSYKIGKAIVESKKSPIKALGLPVRIVKEVILFKKNY